jgi:hypothetical protein
LAPTGCPTKATVAAEIDRLGAAVALDQVGNAEVVVDRGELRILIRDRGAAVLGSRSVAAPTDCQARAALAAVLIAAWTGDWMRTSLNSQSSPTLVAEPSVTSTPAGAHADQLHVAIDAFAFALHDGDAGGWGGGARVDVRWQALGLFAVGEKSADRRRALGPVSAQYNFVRSGVGLCARQQWSGVFADAAVAPEIVRYAISGAGMASANDVVSWQAWADLRARLGVSFGSISPFLYASSSWSFVQQRLILDNRTDAITLSRANFAAGLGISVTVR